MMCGGMSMGQINPFLASVVQAPSAQRLASDQKDRHIRQTVQRQRTASGTEDMLEVSVESSEAIGAIDARDKHDQQQRRRQQGQQQQPAEQPENPSGLNITA